ncbi:MAG: hypothetical protein FWE92_04985 [Defluviitaleaceae bacterium]|nr:hypothetical protein [Defluviitaleaceae bacterium]
MMKRCIRLILAALLILISPTIALATHGFGSAKITVYVDETPFEVYGYDGGDFSFDPSFKLRDIAYILNGTRVQFDITESDDDILNILIGEPLTITGAELQPKEQTYAIFGSYGRFGWADGLSGFPEPFPTTAVLHVDLWDVQPDTEFVHLRVYGGIGTFELMADKPNLAVESFPIEIPFTGIGGATLSLYSVEESGEEVLISHRFISFPDDAIFGGVILRVHEQGQDIEYHTLGVIHDLEGSYFSLFAIADLLGFEAGWSDWSADRWPYIVVSTYLSPPDIEPAPTPTPMPTPTPQTDDTNTSDNNNNDDSPDILASFAWIAAVFTVLVVIWFTRTRKKYK